MSKDRKVELFIFDIYVAILKIKKVASKFDEAKDLFYSFTDWDSVIREFEIIGEATKYLVNNKLIDKKYRVIVDFRNQITHAYFGIDKDIVWFIIKNDLVEFEKVILKLINKIEAGLKQELIKTFIEDNRHLNFIVEALENLK
ncbi:DUF86 domain-containing protein [Deferribacter autotrophicus]|uniref:DUF86 domain-containing protein n=1 Tax=Deferribacter autotrophicus TaxID=500465 RepID=A0A5A8F4Q4_9BACT|nr:HepT-like ribonuclease domain-containing protein [Deferribacter autotrophicus]KAA0257622.1 DUF86 domain-containing protein [Deferribacter autotrophicus]